MKKLIFTILAICVFGLAANAQLVTSRGYGKKERKHNVWMEFGVGTTTAKENGKSLDIKIPSLSLDLRWTAPIGDWFAWDIFTLGATFIPNAEIFEFRIMTGPRVRFPFSENFRLFLANDAGLHVSMLMESGWGFADEVLAGLDYKRFTAGLYYRMHFFRDNYNWKNGGSINSLGLKVGFSF